MSNNIKENMYIGYIVLTVFGFSAVGYYIYQNNFFIVNKKQEGGTLEEKENLISKNENRTKRKIINDNYYHDYYPENFIDNEIDLESGLKNNDKNIILKVNEKNDSKTKLQDNSKKNKNDSKKELQTIDLQDEREKVQTEIVIEIQENQKEIQDFEQSPNKEEFDWLVVDN